MTKEKKDLPISVQTIRRLPQYLRIFYDLHAFGRGMISSSYLAEETKLLPIVVKKDLQAVGVPSKPRAGYMVDGAIKTIEKFLGWNNLNKAFMIGAGDLGSALLKYKGFRNHRLEVVVAFDINPEKVRSEIPDVRVYHPAQLLSVIEKEDLKIAILTVPANVAQGITDTLVQAGIKAIWNFAPVKLSVPPGVVVQQEDISAGLAELCAKLKSR